MALTYTPAVDIGSLCPSFSLPSVDGKTFSLTDFKSASGLLVMFLCGHCPYVQAIEQRLVDLAREFKNSGLVSVGICSNDAADYPEDQPGELYKRWLEKNYAFPYLIDESQQVAMAFAAVCTPDLFLFDSEKKLCYRGRLDDSWRAPERVQRQELRQAIENMLAGRAPSTVQNPSMGCSIKWKKK